MSRNLKYLTLVALFLIPMTAGAEQRRGQGSQGRSSQGHVSQGGGAPRGHVGRGHARKGTQTPRAAALAPPEQLAQTLLPAGARRLPTSPANAPYANWRRWPQPYRPGGQYRGYGMFGGYYGSGYSGSGYYVESTEAPQAPEPMRAATNKGLLQLQITPATGLDYYVDGVYVGSSSNLGSEVEINAGARQVEVRAQGYKSATFDTRIEEGQVTTVRGALEAIERPQAPRSSGSRVMYVIPGCYMGNSKPEASALPVGCDVKKLVTRGAGL